MFSNILLSPVANTTTDMVGGFIGLMGFLITLALTAALIWFIRKPIAQILEKLIGDADVAKKIALFVFFLLGLTGLVAAIGAFYPRDYGVMLFNIDNDFQFGEFVKLALNGLLNLASRFAEVAKWAIVAAAILFVGYSLRGSRG